MDMQSDLRPQQNDSLEGSENHVQQEVSRTDEKSPSQGQLSKGCPSKTSGSVRKDSLE
jgi:hypothetical protein